MMAGQSPLQPTAFAPALFVNQPPPGHTPGHTTMTTATAACPVCNGTCRVPTDATFTSRHYTYDKATDTVACHNCGAQTMSGKPTGQVRVRPDGTPCTHHYKGREAGRCYTVYTCQHCGDSFGIDSSD